MKTRSEVGATDPHAAALSARQCLRECQDLFQQLRPEIERVAPGQKRKRMPAPAYKLWDGLGSLGLYLHDIRVALGDAAPIRIPVLEAPEPETTATPAEQTDDDGKPAQVIDFAKADHFWSGAEAYHYWCEASRAGCNLPSSKELRDAKGDAVYAVQSRVMAIRHLAETAKRELLRYWEAVEASPSKKDRCFEGSWPGWCADKTREMDRLLERINKLPMWPGSPVADVIRLAERRPSPGPFAGGPTP